MNCAIVVSRRRRRIRFRRKRIGFFAAPALTRVRAALGMTLFALTACAPVGPDYTRPDIAVPSGYPASDPKPTGATLAAVPADWWRLYDDATLDRLVAAGLASGTDVRLAIARVEEARALVREANATLLPQVNASGNAGRSGASEQTGPIRAGGVGTLNNFSLAVSTSFELDFWGRLRRLQEAAQAQLSATEYARSVVALTLSAAIARTYFNVRSLDAQIVVSDETLKSADDSVTITRQRSEAGIASALDVYQAQGIRSQLAAQIKELRRLRAVAMHQWACLPASSASSSARRLALAAGAAVAASGSAVDAGRAAARRAPGRSDARLGERADRRRACRAAAGDKPHRLARPAE